METAFNNLSNNSEADLFSLMNRMRTKEEVRDEDRILDELKKIEDLNKLIQFRYKGFNIFDFILYFDFGKVLQFFVSKIPDILPLLLQNPGGYYKYLIFDSTFTPTETSVLRVIISIPGFDVNIRDNIGRTLLMIASEYAVIENIELLLKHGADANLVDEYGNSALHYTARRYSHEDIYRRSATILIEQGRANVSQTNNNGDTPLHLACRKACYPAAFALLRHGACWSCKNEKGETPLDILRDLNLDNEFITMGRTKILEYISTIQASNTVGTVSKRVRGEDAPRMDPKVITKRVLTFLQE